MRRALNAVPIVLGSLGLAYLLWTLGGAPPDPGEASGGRILPYAALLVVVVAWDLLIGGRVLWHRRRDVGWYLAIVAQLAVLGYFLRDLTIAEPAFHLEVFAIAASGFCLHHLVPARHRTAFFALLSVVAIVRVLGVEGGLSLIAVGCVLIAICHFPASFGVRVGAVVLAAIGLALARGGSLPWPWPAAVWPILGSMFMFRMVVYLYHLRHHPGPLEPSWALSYFFMLPNVVFPLFPVVDYATFKRTYYSEDAFKIYQDGVRWLVLAVIHLLAYRVVYQNFTLPPEDVTSLTDFARHASANFALYLRVSGQFHLIVGLLHLFGFALPPTHHFFFLSSSFTDFWRRINIYWKDFMLKTFFNPVYFRLRDRGPWLGLAVATFVVFFSTWLLHSYQWFWLRGSFPITVPDAAFWGMLAVFVLVNSIQEMKRGRRRALTLKPWSLREEGVKALKTVGFFTFISMLWSLWSSPTFAEWLLMVRRARVSAQDVLLIGGILAGLVVVVGAIQEVVRRAEYAGKGARIGGGLRSSAGLAVAGMAALALLLVPADRLPLGSGGLAVLDGVRTGRLSAADAALLQRGYYEDLTEVIRYNSPLWELYSKRPENSFETFQTGGFQRTDLIPSHTAVLAGAVLRTNSYGMRDRLYALEPGPGVFRIALLGQSAVMGFGVEDGETFESLLEVRLNEEHGGVEILNFAISDTPPTAQILILREKALPFSPHAVFFVTHHTDGEKAAQHLVDAYVSGIEIPFPELVEMLEAEGVTRYMTASEAEARIAPHEEEIAAWAYRRLVEEIEGAGAEPVAICFALPGDPVTPEREGEVAEMAREAGFEVLDVSNVWDGRDEEELRLSRTDLHPNPAGHRIIAERIYEALMRNPDIVPRATPREGVPASGR